MKDGQQIRFTGEGDQEPDIEVGDVVIVLDEKEHDVFRRRGADLITKMELALVEALCGFQRGIQTLDDRTLVVSTIPGEVIQHGDMKSIDNEGMPRHKNPFEKGRLIVAFEVKFPTDGWLPAKKLAELEAILPKRPRCEVPASAEECTMRRYDPNTEPRQHRRAGGEAYESDEEEGMNGGGQRVQCASQ